MDKKAFFIKNYQLIIILIFIILSATLIFYHEPYRDEAQAWLIARDSQNIPDLLSKMRQEGTPPLWHLILYPLAQLDFPYYSMQIVSFIIILLAVIIFLKYSPFNWKIKAIFPFGYFVLYQLNVIARNYGIGLLLLFIIATLDRKKMDHKKTYLLAVILLGLTSLHGFVIAIIFGAFFIYELIPKAKRKKFISIAVIIIAAISLMGVLLVSFEYDKFPIISEYSKKISARAVINDQTVITVAKPIINAFFPIQENQIHFIDNNILFSLLNNNFVFISLLGGAILILALFSIRKTKKHLARFVVCIIGLELIFWIILSGGMRHHWFIFALFIVEIWMFLNEKNSTKNKKLKTTISLKKTNKYKALLSNIVLALLIIQVIASAIPANYEINYNFSNSKEVATKETAFLNNCKIIATYSSAPTSSIIPYLTNHKKAYCLEYAVMCSYMIWGNTFETCKDECALGNNLKQLEKKENEFCLILTNESQLKYLDSNYTLISKTNDSIIQENYYLYKYKR